jgi:D-arabinose 1-dehydrogenase-like Zn-dependent alcohol dehydrogenase
MSDTETTYAYVFEKEAGELVRREVNLPALGADMVDVEITVTSMCSTDHSLGYNLWKGSTYPMVAGHEGVGVVRRIGSSVSMLKVGDRVAIGWMGRSCGSCRRCQQGEESQCFNETPALIFRFGGTFGEHVRLQEKFAFPLPAALSATEASALMCAGITVYRPLRVYAQGPGTRVAVVGIGGLGHLALQFAHKLGFHVTAISRSERKRERSLELGADQYVASSDAAQMEAVRNSIDLILYTANAGGVEPYFDLLRNGGTLVQLGIPAVNERPTTAVPVVRAVFGSLQYASSLVGGSVHTNEMLEFAARHGITARGVVLPIEKLPECMERYHKDNSSAPFRWVFTTAAYDESKPESK